MRTSVKGIAAEWYTLSGEEGEIEPVQFYIKPLDGMAWTSVLMESYSPETGEIGGEGLNKAFMLGVKGWRGIEDADNPGKPLRFSRQAMLSMRPAWILEVGQHILAISEISSEQAKNSDSPSSSP